MKNYTDSDYALNKYSKNIVYRFADRILEVTLEDYLAENPDKTEADFVALKKISDTDYLNQVRDENAQTYKNVSLNELGEAIRRYEKSPEENLVNAISEQEEAERKRQLLNMASQALDKLTEIQRRRYLMHHVKGKTTREIAEAEGVAQRTVMDSLEFAEKKIKKILAGSKK